MLHTMNGHRRTISGASLAQLIRHMSPAERACLGADVVDGTVLIVGLTAKSVANLVDVNIGYLDAALKLPFTARAEVRRGERPLISKTRMRPPIPFDWSKVDDNVLVEAVRKVRIDRALHAMVVAEAEA